ncbi:hypothetical protein A2Y85_03310 [candidate division WOR-3 bacterium RBG_13_43_14]|uniref:NIF system FeS cluster assembly NifU N-terminal domain-containing protein n=1 Tax=candidate division WOR-3 bacterium RBG_13_43_14 TaxID=1802590 RepID=A0A1F4UA95_UNCW3|nr:MAG: hypothetical protein A2Y85_03310 [candidate division WOR-3 bacterium RBG_13_43_14]
MGDSELDKFAEKTQAEIIRELKEIYSPVVIDHWLNPRNWGIMNDADGYAKITGPCGDTMEFSIKIKNDRITHCTFDTDGCGTTIACASIAAEMTIGKNINEARKINQAALLQYCGGLPDENKHCALLASNTLQKTIDNCLANKQEPWRRLYE